MKNTGSPSHPVQLDNASLKRLPANVRGPAYDRREVTDGILHIGVGGFHRAHQGVYVDDVIRETGANQWGICGVGLLQHDSRMRDSLVPQDCLYAVVELGPGADTKARVIGSMTSFLFAPENTGAVLEKMASADIRIVSLTITEGDTISTPRPGNPTWTIRISPTTCNIRLSRSPPSVIWRRLWIAVVNGE